MANEIRVVHGHLAKSKNRDELEARHARLEAELLKAVKTEPNVDLGLKEVEEESSEMKKFKSAANSDLKRILARAQADLAEDAYDEYDEIQG